jgi:hypothetical protein
MRSLVVLTMACVLPVLGCGGSAPPPKTEANPVAPPKVEEKPVPAMPLASLTELASSDDPMDAFQLENTIVRSRVENGRVRLARYEGTAFVGEEQMSKGLPPLKSADSEPCEGVSRIFGRFPERAWLVINNSGSAACGGTSGAYALYHWQAGQWQLDKARTPKKSNGIFATWDLGHGVVGFGEGDTLHGPRELLFTWGGDPWKRRVKLPFNGQAELACADEKGTAYVSDGKTLYRVTLKGASKIGPLPPAISGSTCAAAGKKLYALDATKAVLTIDTATGKFVKSAPVTGTPSNLVTDGKQLVVYGDLVLQTTTLDSSGAPTDFHATRLTAVNAGVEATLIGLDKAGLLFELMRPTSPRYALVRAAM